VAALLDLSHRLLIAKKITLSSNNELAVGAVAESEKSLFLNCSLIDKLEIDPQKISRAISAAINKVKETKSRLGLKENLDVEGKRAIIVDDGAATGATMMAAIKEIRTNRAKKIIVALPVAPKETVQKLKREADEVIVLEQPEIFFSVSQFYEDFPQVSWEEVGNLLKLTLTGL